MIKNIYFIIVHKYLKGIKSSGTLSLELPDGRVFRYGNGTESDLLLLVKSQNAFRRILFSGDIGFAEAYMNGELETPDLTALLTFLAGNADSIGGRSGFRPGIIGIFSFAYNLRHFLSANSKRKARENIRVHYDLPPDFFSQFLDTSMMYSAARFPKKDLPLYDAQITKLDELIEKMDVKPGDRVLEIGSGWGALACRLAETKGVHVLTVTLSQEQLSHTRQRIHANGLKGRVEARLLDYRDLTGNFDAIISIEMIEAVGLKYMNTFFARCQKLLSPGGKLVLQAITIPERYFYGYQKRSDFIQTYIFPGGMLPSVPFLIQSASKKRNLELLDFQDATDDYSLTLQSWRESFAEKRNAIKNQGFSETFIRMWDYYLSYCEAGFKTKSIGLARIVFQKKGNRSDQIFDLDRSQQQKKNQ